jgi:hypothetical protein
MQLYEIFYGLSDYRMDRTMTISNKNLVIYSGKNGIEAAKMMDLTMKHESWGYSGCIAND